MRPRCLARCLVVLLAAAAAVGAQPSGEVVHTEFDLVGWHRLGLVSVEAPAFQRGTLEDLLDDSPHTVVELAADPATLVLRLRPSQIVRRVTLRPGTLDPYAVTLTVVDQGGRRFAAGDSVVGDGNTAFFRLLDVPIQDLEFEIERLESADTVSVSSLRVSGEVTVSGLSLEEVPETIPEGGSFPIKIVGRDSFGGRPDLTLFAQLRVTPSRALALVERRRAVARVGGPLSIAPHLGALEGLTRPLLVIPLQAAPPPPVARPGLHLVTLQLEGAPPFEVFRRGPGEKSASPLGRALGSRFFDEVPPGAAYWYSVRRSDRFGNALTPVGEETWARTLSREPPGHESVGRLPLLFVLYEDSFGPEAARAALESLEFARLFVYRHSRGRLALDLTVLRLAGPTPASDGPSMTAIEQQLREVGVGNDRFGLVFAQAQDFPGDWGNFTLLGRGGGALGRGERVPTPEGVLGPDPAVAWSFVHELLHVVQGRMAASTGRTDLPTGDLDQDHRAGLFGQTRGRVLDAGEAWDGAAALLGQIDWWAEVGPPFRLPYETVDTDGDGLSDDDPFLPLDEKRFGTDPGLADSDGDGLDDRSEAAAGLYGPTNPRHFDTDGDGLQDGEDPWPLERFTGSIPRGTEPVPLASGPEFERPSIGLAACWSAAVLVFAVDTRVPCDVFLDLDGSGALGRWETDVNTGSEEEPSSDVWCGPARIALRAHHEPRGVFVGGRALPEASVEAFEREGRWVLVARLPADLGPGASDVLLPSGAPLVAGLRLQPGTVLGLAVTVRPAQSDDPTPFEAFPEDRPWAGLFETHRLFDAVLVE